MTRPLRLEFPGALYHVTARGNARQSIFVDDEDRHSFLELLAKEVGQQGWLCYAYCLMDNHYHMLIETPEANLVSGMRRLSGAYTQRFNRRHERVGHLFQGRYKAILVDKDSYLLELCRYIVLNPLRAKAVKRLEQWPWSSYAASGGGERPPAWLAVDRVQGLFANVAAYRRFVAEGLVTGSPWEKLRGQIYLGSEAFLERMQRRLPERRPKAVSSSHLHPSRPTAAAIEAAVAKAYRVKGEIYDRANPQPYRATIYLLRRAANLPLAEVAKRAGISPGRVSQIQTEIEKNRLPMPLQKLIAGYKLKP